MKNLLVEKLTVANKKIRMKPSKKLLVKPSGNRPSIFVDVHGETDLEIKEIYLNGIKSVMQENKFHVEYPLHQAEDEARVYGHDDPKNPNYALVKYHVSKMAELIEHSRKFFAEVAVKSKLDVKKYEYFLEFRIVSKTKFYEPFFVLKMYPPPGFKIQGNFIEKDIRPDGSVRFFWLLDETYMTFKVNKDVLISKVKVASLYPDELIPWEKTQLEQELDPKLPETLFPDAKKKTEQQEPLNNKEIK